MDDSPSDRVIEQRLRNRAIEALEVLAQGDDGVRAVGNSDYINYFFDTIDDDVLPGWRDSSALTPDEVLELDRVQRVLLDACSATPQVEPDDDFIASGWPERIKPIATDALAVMLQRGRFREDREEDAPSG